MGSLLQHFAPLILLLVGVIAMAVMILLPPVTMGTLAVGCMLAPMICTSDIVVVMVPATRRPSKPTTWAMLMVMVPSMVATLTTMVPVRVQPFQHRACVMARMVIISTLLVARGHRKNLFALALDADNGTSNQAPTLKSSTHKLRSLWRDRQGATCMTCMILVALTVARDHWLKFIARFRCDFPWLWALVVTIMVPSTSLVAFHYFLHTVLAHQVQWFRTLLAFVVVLVHIPPVQSRHNFTIHAVSGPRLGEIDITGNVISRTHASTRSTGSAPVVMDTVVLAVCMADFALLRAVRVRSLVWQLMKLATSCILEQVQDPINGTFMRPGPQAHIYDAN